MSFLQYEQLPPGALQDLIALQNFQLRSRQGSYVIFLPCRYLDFFRHWWVPSTKHQDCINPRSRILTMENNRGSSSKRSIEQCVAPVPPAPARRSCLKKTGKKGIRPTVKNCVSFDLGKNDVWTIKDWTLPITLQRRETSNTARIQEGWVFDEGGVDVVMTDVWII